MARESGTDEEQQALLSAAPVADNAWESYQVQQPEKQQVAVVKRSVLRTVCPFILGNELCERLAFYGLATNLVTYMTRVMGGDPANAAILVAVFEGSCYTTPIIGALLADSCWGRYKTILVFSLVYLMGIVLLTISSVIPDTEEDAETANPLQYAVLFTALGVISLGTGGIKPNVSAFGADQFNEADPDDRKEKESFFNWFYLAINVGSLIASTFIVYIQDSISWTIGFAIPGFAMLLAIALFWAGSSGYRHIPPTESPMSRVAKVVWAAWKNRWATRKHHHDPSVNANRVVATSRTPPQNGSYHGAHLYNQNLLDHQKSYVADDGQDETSHLLHGHHGPADSHNGSMPRNDSRHQMPLVPSMSYRWLEDAVTEWQTSQGHLVQQGSLAGFTPKQVEEVKMVIRLLPIFCATVLYWTVYTQMGTLFVQQGNLMAREWHWDGQVFKLPSASMSLFNTLSVIVLVWLYDAVLEPALKKTKGYKMTLLRRIGWGMLVAAIAMAYAGGLEAWRLSTLREVEPCPAGVMCTHDDGEAEHSRHLLASVSSTFSGPFGGMGSGIRRVLFQAGLGNDSTPDFNDSDMISAVRGYRRPCRCPNEPSTLSIFWQAPSYFLIGLSEVFTSIGQLEFFYDQAPDVMRSCSMALCLLSTALGSYLAGALTWAVQAFSKAATGTEWLPRDLNQGHIDYFFYFLMIVMLLNLGGFLAVALRYRYKAVDHKRQVAPAAIIAAHDQQQQQYGALPQGRHSMQGDVIVPIPASSPHGTAPMAIGRSSFTHPVPPTALSPEDIEVYSRSLAYVPQSPNLPAPFR